MTIAGTSSQPFVALCLLLGGMIYSALCFFVGRIDLNKVVFNIISFFIALVGAVVYFTILYLVNSGEMRLFTLLSFLLGLICGYKILNQLIRKPAKKQ
jgi:uncharacterized membrane protein YeaQ/YmgE (transglycosylase-associated protein family)